MTRAEGEPALPGAEGLTLATTLPRGLVILGRKGDVRFANAAARALEGAPTGRRGPGGRWTLLVDALGKALEGLAVGERASVRLEVAGIGALRVAARRNARGHLVALPRREELRWEDSCRTLAARSGLSSSATRLALRVVSGQTLRDIAAAFRLPEGTVKSRLSHLYHALGVHNRAGLALAVRATAATVDAPAEQSPAPPVIRLPLPEICETLLELPLGLCVLRHDGELRWANRAARSVLGLRPGARRSRLLDRALGDQRGLGRAPSGVRVPHDPAPVHVLLWEAGELPIGALVHMERIRTDAAAAARLRARGLTPRQAELVLLVASGQSHAAIARGLALHVGTVASTVAAAYRRLGLGSRDEVVSLLARFPALHDPPED